MNMEFHSWKNYSVNGVEGRKFFPVGLIFEADGYFKLRIYLFPDLEYFLVEEADSKGHLKSYSIHAVQPFEREGAEDMRDLRIGIMKITKNGGIYLQVNCFPVSYKVLDKEGKYVQYLLNY